MTGVLHWITENWKESIIILALSIICGLALIRGITRT